MICYTIISITTKNSRIIRISKTWEWSKKQKEQDSVELQKEQETFA